MNGVCSVHGALVDTLTDVRLSLARLETSSAIHNTELTAIRGILALERPRKDNTRPLVARLKSKEIVEILKWAAIILCAAAGGESLLGKLLGG